MAFASLALGRFLTGRGRLDRDGGPFLILLGVTGYVLLFGLPLWTGLRSLGWIPVGCVVQGAMVQSERDTGMFAYTVYWPDVVYQYRVAGETYRANTHNAAFVGSPWYYGARRVVREHSPGRITTCYVNPGDPSEAVLVRGPSDTQWVGLWAMFLVALGIDSIVTAHTGRHLLHGRSPRVLGAVALWTVAGLAFTVLLAIADDLRADVRAGAAELPEYALVALVGALAVGLVPCCVATLLPNRGQRQAGRRVKTAPVAPVVWDREIDG